MTSDKVRWGILSTAFIARKNWQAIHLSGNGVLVAVASRERSKAERFIRECQAAVPLDPPPRACDSYEALLAAPDIDAVYIPLPTGRREEWVVRAAAAGKHVVCEKPCATTAGRLRGLIAACRQNRVQFMDGVMFRHSGRFERMRAALHEEHVIGQIRRVTSAFSFRAPDNFFTSDIRAQPALEPLGCLGDLGWYCVQFSLWTAGWRQPRAVAGRMLSAHAPAPGAASVPTEFSGELIFDDHLSASFLCSFLADSQQWGHVSGTRGTLRVDDFVLPYAGGQISFETRRENFQAAGCDFRMQPECRKIVVAENGNGAPDAQEVALFRNFGAQVKSGSLNETWPAIALQTQTIIEAARSRPSATACRWH